MPEGFRQVARILAVILGVFLEPLLWNGVVNFDYQPSQRWKVFQ